MNTKLMVWIFQIFAALEFSVLRFNYRSTIRNLHQNIVIGGEEDDVINALSWLKSTCPIHKDVWVVGFSFGAWMASKIPNEEHNIDKILLINPPVAKYKFSNKNMRDTLNFIIQSSDDVIAKKNDLDDFLASKTNEYLPITRYDVLNNADHFLQNNKKELELLIKDYVATYTT